MGRSPYMGGIFGLKKADYDAADAAMELLGILDIAKQPVTALSGGQRQRLALASILITKPKMLL